MDDILRGDGLFRADNALAELVENPQHLDRARGRFSDSPPSYRSHLSHNSTRSQSPNPPSEGQQRREERQWKLMQEHRASLPANQFDAEKREELSRLQKATRDPTRRPLAGTSIYKLSEENVKARWVEQGIWNEKWKGSTVWRWKHEELFEPESESETDSAAESEAPLFGAPSQRVQAKPRRRKNAEELRRIAERRPVREREREASRPFYQFVYQVSKERERIEDELNPPGAPGLDFSDLNVTLYGSEHYQAALKAWSGGTRTRNERANVERAAIPTPLDINSTAYERVKEAWVKGGIWNRKWGVLPGMSWKHEQPLEEMLREELGDDATTPIQANALGVEHGTGEVPPRSIFADSLPADSPNDQASNVQSAPPQESLADALEGGGSGIVAAPPTRSIFRSPSVESSHGSTPQEPSASDPAELQNGCAGHPSVASNSSRRCPELNGDALPSATQRKRRWGDREPSIEGARTTARDVLGPFNSAKVSKTRGKSGPGARRRSNSSELLSEAQQSLPGPGVPAPTPRRSRRLQKAERETTPDPDLRAGGSQSRFGGTNTSPKPGRLARPQGVSKGRPRTTRRRAR